MFSSNIIIRPVERSGGSWKKVPHKFAERILKMKLVRGYLLLSNLMYFRIFNNINRSGERKQEPIPSEVFSIQIDVGSVGPTWSFYCLCSKFTFLV